MEPTAKTCKTCCEELPLGSFHKMKANKDGRHNVCKVCRRKVEQARSAAKRQDPAYRERDRARSLEYSRERRAADPAAYAEYQRQWRAANPGKSAAYGRKHYHKDLEASRARSKAHRLNNPELYQGARLRYLEANPGAAAAATAKWLAANPDKTAEYNGTRRALKLSATTDGPVDYAAIRAAHDDCYLCGKVLTNPVHMDHVTPLSRGGAHAAANLLPTHARCNLRKSDKRLSELPWYRGPADPAIGRNS